MTYYAKFSEIGADLFRFDTRVYLQGGNPSEESECVGAVVGMNPGSARPRFRDQHHELDLGRDKMLPYVRNRFNHAFRLAGMVPPWGAYVQILNVFYLCNANSCDAIDRVSNLADAPTCSSEFQRFPITWYAWGAEDQALAPLKARFLERRDGASIYMRRDRKSFGRTVPGPMEFAKHPRCMPAAPVEIELSQHLSNRIPKCIPNAHHG